MLPRNSFVTDVDLRVCKMETFAVSYPLLRRRLIPVVLGVCKVIKFVGLGRNSELSRKMPLRPTELTLIVPEALGVVMPCN